ncbi:MAG TPA: FtsW/RodA/SpoVE family cell cycle protein, partial [Blastocatellia bacterium]|nr:FtsW/RodA/SpoVE family cell cycle protein [Blastocatellia bacterium]
MRGRDQRMAAGSRVISPRWKRDSEFFSGSARVPKVRELPVDRVLLATVLGLTLFGAVMVYSASAILAEQNYGSQFYFLSRQGLWATVGVMAMAAAMFIDYRHYKRPVVLYSVLGVTLAMLAVVLFLPTVNETHRWIRYGRYFSLQPSEITKLALAAFLGMFLERQAREIENFKATFLRAAGVAGLMIC